MSDHRGIRHVEIGVADLARSLDFYRDLLDLTPMDTSGEGPGVAWLSAGSVLLKLVETGDGDLGGWVNDDLQRGIRHIGFKVGDVDLRAERVRDAGVPFTLPPLDAVGGVRIAFFQDPDGTHLEITDNYLRYHRVASPELAERERLAALSRPRTAPPVFDHVAVTSADLDAALAFYRDTLGYEVIGRRRGSGGVHVHGSHDREPLGPRPVPARLPARRRRRRRPGGGGPSAGRSRCQGGGGRPARRPGRRAPRDPLTETLEVSSRRRAAPAGPDPLSDRLSGLGRALAGLVLGVLGDTT